MRTILVAARKVKELTWNNAVGQAAVSLFSLQRIGWIFCEESSFIDDKGTILTLEDYGPREIKTLLGRAAQD